MERTPQEMAEVAQGIRLSTSTHRSKGNRGQMESKGRELGTIL
jgi:hypothetical protein